MIAFASEPEDEKAARLRAQLGARSVVLVGMMGAGKSSVGKRLARRLGLPFADADNEIESAAGMSIPDIFTHHGEPAFRDGERRVIARLLEGGPLVLATGGGAFMNAETRARIAEHGLSVWLKADLDVLWDRVNKRDTRPLLKTENPKQTLENLMNARYPVYAEADLTVLSRDVRKEVMADEVLRAVVEAQKESAVS
jgi:shikimate kinase